MAELVPIRFDIYCAVHQDVMFDLLTLVRKWVQNVTFEDAWGMYDGEVENGFHLTFVGVEEDRAKMVKLADELREAADQLSVLLTETKLESSMIIRAVRK